MTRRGRGRPPYPDILTPAEWRILDEVRTGATNAEIAIKLGISPYTVKYHVSNILGKLELRNRRQIATWQPERERLRLPQMVGARLRAFLAPLALLPKPLIGVAAGAVVTLVAIPTIVLAILLTRPEEPVNVLLTPDPSPSPAAPATATPSPTPAATPDPSPTPAPEASPTPEPTPEPEPTPDPTPEPTPEPTPAPPIDSTPNALGIREIRTDEAFTRLEYAPGELIDEEAPIYFLDVETGAVEGWKSVAGIDPFFSHGYRYAATDAALHDRETGRTFAWDPDALQVAGFGEPPPSRVSTDSYSIFISDERVAFRRLDVADDSGVQRYVIVDASMNELAAFEIPSDWDILRWNLAAGFALASDGAAMHIIDVSAGSSLAIDQPDAPRPPTSGEWFASVEYAGEFARVASARDDSGPPVSGAQGSCQAVRRDWGSGTVLSDTTVDCFLGGGAGAHLSPDGALLAAVTLIFDCCDEWFGHAFYNALTAVSLFDATTGDELLRVGGATFPFRQGVGYGAVWLADSSGLVVATVQGLQIVTVDGRWVPLSPVLSQGHLRPSPVDPERFIHDSSATVVDLSGEVVVTPNFEESVTLARSAWNPSGQELRLLPEVPGKGASPLAPSILPAIQTPPFDDALTAVVVVDTCLNVRTEATTESEIVVCLPPERVVELVAHPTDGHLVEGPCVEDDLYGNCVWVHVLTEDGEQGWAYADFLRWSGIPLAPAPDPPAPRG